MIQNNEYHQWSNCHHDSTQWGNHSVARLHVAYLHAATTELFLETQQKHPTSAPTVT